MLDEAKKLLRSDNVFLQNPELLDALITDKMTVTEIAKKVNTSVAYVSKLKKKLKEGIKKKKPSLIRKIEKENEQFIEEIAEKTKLNTEYFSKLMKELINQSSFIVQEINNSDPELWRPDWIRVKLLAMKRLEEQIVLYMKEFKQISALNASAEVQLIKQRLERVVEFLTKTAPHLVPEFIKFLEGEEINENKTKEIELENK